MTELPDPNAGDGPAYVEAWEGRIRDEEEYDVDVDETMNDELSRLQGPTGYTASGGRATDMIGRAFGQLIGIVLIGFVLLAVVGLVWNVGANLADHGTVWHCSPADIRDRVGECRPAGDGFSWGDGS